MGGFSIWHWLIVLIIIVLLFGTKKLKSLGQDIGEAVKNFKHALTDQPKETDKETKSDTSTNSK